MDRADLAVLVLAGGRGSRMGPLTKWRAKPVLPFLGVRRLIDFAIENGAKLGCQMAVLVNHQRESVRSYVGARSCLGIP